MKEYQDDIVMDVGVTLPGCCAILLLCVLYAIYKKFLHVPTPKKTRQYTACTNPECVRCSLYDEIRRQAPDKLHEYTMQQSQDHNLFSRIKQAIQQPTDFTENSLQQPNVLYIPDLTAEPWWQNTNENIFSDDIASLENKHEYILHEYKRISIKQDHPWNVNETAMSANLGKGKWNMFYFYNQGVRMNENCALCPYTASVIDSLTNFMSGSLFGNASFSVLDSNTTISEHYGPTNIRLRCHLGKKLYLLKVNLY